jgi:hypothetical protein
MTNHKAKYVLPAPAPTGVDNILLLRRSFFKKWLELEKRQGDEEGAEAVKQKAIQWTQRDSE